MSLDAESLLQLVYVSSATTPLDDAALAALLAQSRENNARGGVTGMLLYKDGNFLQLIEGAEAAVRALHARILRDARHQRVITIIEDRTAERQFPGWSMGFVPADRMPTASVEAFTPFLLPGGDPARFAELRGQVREVLDTFRRNLR